MSYENPYYKTNHDLYNVPEAQFSDYLQREGVTVSDYWTGEEYSCFFRRNKDTNQTNDNISVYYPVGSGIQPGSLINHYGCTYLILNQESRENQAYRRSDGLNADVTLNTYDAETMQDICLPCFAYDLTGTTPDISDVMSVINGNVELMTGDNEVSRLVKVNCEFYAMGNWYTVVSINHKTNITRIGAAIIQGSCEPVVYGLDISAGETFIEGSVAELNAAPTVNSQPVVNATLEWSSSDPSVATITDNGEAQFIGAGTCTITCRWKERNITSTVEIEVVATPAVVEYTCEITGDEAITTSQSATYTAIFYQADGITEDTSATPVWSLDVPSAISHAVSISTQSNNTVSITIASGSSLVGKSFSLNLTDTNEQYHATKSIRIKSWF